MIAIDIEASGTDNRAHSIVSVGAIDLRDPTRQFYDECRIWDGAHIMESALAVNGFSEAEIMDPQKKSEAELVEALLAWIYEADERTLAGQNVSFDRDFIEAAARRAGMEADIAYRTVDTHTLCYMHMTVHGRSVPLTKHHSGLDLDAILRYCGIPEEPTPHNALTGALCHAETISRLLYGKKLLPEFERYDMP
ncbi:3'-5' exonuclease [Candidatus Kaiserbacteria bacterium]|nr:3'-5' exonuclease [Candidatus Kaiserbacteria bacterium]